MEHCLYLGLCRIDQLMVSFWKALFHDASDRFQFSVLLAALEIVLLAVTAYVALRTFRFGQQQRKVENAFQLVELFDKMTSERQREEWKDVAQNLTPSSNGEQGFYFKRAHYLVENDGEEPFWGWDGDRTVAPLIHLLGHGSEPRETRFFEVCDHLNLVARRLNNQSADIEITWFHLGEYFNRSAEILQHIDKQSKTEGEAFSTTRYSDLLKLANSREVKGILSAPL